MPLCIDLFCGLGGWSDGFLSEGWRVLGFDIERHVYGDHKYPGQLILQDALTLHGSQFRDADCIVASPPCKKYSWMAMPWSRAKAQAAEIRADMSGRMRADLNALFDCCFRIQREASEAAGHHIPMVVENVKGAQPWVGRAGWHHGSFYLWGDVPAIMPHTWKLLKRPGRNFEVWDTLSKSVQAALATKTIGHANIRDGYSHTRHLTNQRESDALRQEGIKQHGSGPIWFDQGIAKHSSHSDSRKAASAMIAKIPFELSSYIARYYHPRESALQSPFSGRRAADRTAESTAAYQK